MNVKSSNLWILGLCVAGGVFAGGSNTPVIHPLKSDLPLAVEGSWKPVPGHIRTAFAEAVSPENAWPEYPRPQMVRAQWQSLNGLWDYAIVGEEKPWTGGYVENAPFDPLTKSIPAPPARWDGKILVPFCPESALSGVGRLVRPDQLLWYRRAFAVPPAWAGQRLLLHFEAVDWHSVVWLNGVKVGDNKGGYVPFDCDVTEALKPSGPQELVLVVWDPTNLGDQAVGKQALPEQKKGFRYTPTTGIWQSVWLEPAGELYIEQLKLTPDVDKHQLTLEARLRGDATGCRLEAQVFDGGKQVAAAVGSPTQTLSLAIARPKLWRPESPFLYDVKVRLQRSGRTLDEVSSYCGMRKVEIRDDERGLQRIELNHQPVFQFGPLDQGYWPESLLTPPSDAAAKFDVQYLRDIGCNMARVHIKVHPRRWYYWCDKLGLLVWQDFPSTRKLDPNITGDSSAQWEREQDRLLDHLHNDPSIVMWVVFNEGWGQYDTGRLAAWVARRDPSRLVDSVSGWTDAGAGPLYDVHDYTFHPAIPAPGQVTNRAVVLGECGGFNLVLPGHTWEDYAVKKRIDPGGDSNREDYPDVQSWSPRYEGWLDGLRLLRPLGLNAAVYTQITDVEHECNGWLTYDRAVSKIPVARLKTAHDRLYGTCPPLKPFLPMWSDGGAAGRLATGQAPAGWTQVEFDDSGWQAVRGPLGRGPSAHRLDAGPGGSVLLRRSFDLDRVPRQAAVRIVAQGPTRLFLNGAPVKTLSTSDLAGFIPTSVALLSPDAVEKLRQGRNVLAVEIPPAKSAGDVVLDVGLYAVELPGGTRSGR